MIKTEKELVNYLENYPQTTSTAMDTVFSLFKSDVSSIANKWRNGEAYTYTKAELLDFLAETGDTDNLEAVQDSPANFFVTVQGIDEVYPVY